MGKGVIVEHLGDAHYRIGLDIDVSYARDQLTAINLYLAEFAEKYQEATDAKNEAQAALAPINTRLTEYLADAQAASQAAYDALVAAYDVWVDAVANQPDPEIIAPLREAMDVWFDGFATTHNDYILALDGDPQAELPVPDALESRTHALQQLTLAMGDWLGAVGALIDPAAVNTAFDALGLALDDFEAATAAYAAEPGNPTLKSAMNYYQGVYESAHSDWVKAVDDNSGDEYVKAARDAYDAAAEAFDNARAALGKLLDNGGMPPELADIMAEQERAYATYHGALQNWQSLTLIKTEKETAKAELMSRLLPFTNNDGEPVRQSVNAWCCDATEDIALGAEVATIEIPSERDLGVRVRPAYESRETYSAARDGKLQPSWSSSPEATYWNWALHPGNARWNPNYRLGEILFIDPLTDKCTVQLDPQRNNEKSRARDGRTLDVINPVKYQIDPDTGEQTPILPGDNVQVADGVTTLTDVPIEYMECNAAVFEVGDKVMVEFQNRDWQQPKVIGFAENPKPCFIHGLMIRTSSGLAADSGAEIIYPRKTQTALGYEFQHRKYDNEAVAGYVTWVSTDGKTVLSWNGPRGRYFPQSSDGISYQSSNPSGVDGHLYYVMKNPDVIEQPENDFVLSLYYAADDRNRVYKDRRIYAQPPLPFDQAVLGAAEVDATDENGRTTWLMIVVSTLAAQPGGKWYFQFTYGQPDPAQAISVYAKAITTTAGASTEWVKIAEDDLSSVPGTIPTNKCAFFSGNADRFALLVPRVKPSDRTTQFGDVAFGNAFEVMNDAIVRGALTLTSTAVTCELTVTEQEDASIIGSYFGNCTADGADGYVLNESYSYSGTNSAIVAIDYDGVTEKQLIATISCSAAGTTNKSEKGYREDFLSDYSLSASESHSGTATFRLEDQDGNVICEYEDVESRDSSTSHVEPSGETTYANQTISVTVNRSGRLPLYYDLRDGSSLFVEHETTAVSTITRNADGENVAADVEYTTWLTDGASVWGHYTKSSDLPTQERSYLLGIGYYDYGLNWGRGVNDAVATLVEFNHASASDAANAINIPQGYQIGPLFRNALWVRMWGTGSGDVLASVGAYLSVHSIALMPSWPGGVFVTLNNSKGAMIWDEYSTIPNEGYTIDQQWRLTDHDLNAIWGEHLAQHPNWEGGPEFIDAVYQVVGNV